MRILVFDTWLPLAHRKLYNSIIELLSRSNKMIVINKGGYYDVMSENIVYVNAPLLDLERGGLWYKRLVHFVNFFLAKLCIIGKRYDSVLVTTYHTRHFKWQKRWLGRKALFLMEHYNVDDIARPSMLGHYLCYANTVHHLVFAPFIGDYLHSLGVNNKLIHFIHHPLFTVNVPIVQKTNDDYINVLSPGLSNDEAMVDSIIEHEKEFGTLEKNRVRLFLRSKKEYDSNTPAISFIKGFLSNEEYEGLYNASDIVLVIYPSTYRYRFSSVILNSMTKHKVLLGNNIDIVRYFSDKYPSNCLVFNDIEDFFKIVVESHYFSETERDIFIKEHSNESIEKELNFIFTSVSVSDF